MKLVLASKSEARAALLRGAGLAFETVSAGVDEDGLKRILAHLSPRDLAIALAEAKAITGSRHTSGLVIGADQTLEIDGRAYDKAPTLEAARERLLLLRGRPHQLHSSVVVAEDGDVLWETTRTATLTARDYSDAFIEGYLARNGQAVLGSVGCYMLEGEGVQLFERIEGDYFTILGLPLLPLLAYLRERGVVPT